MDFFELIQNLNAGALLPEGILILAILSLLVADLIGTNQFLPFIPAVGFLGSMGALALQFNDSAIMTFGGSFQADSLSIVFRFFLALSGFLCVLVSLEYLERTRTATSEFLVLLSTATLGGMLLAGSNDLISMFIALETLGLASYLLTGYMKRDARSNEAALKYLLVGGASSCCFLYGCSWLYGLSGGHLEINYLANALLATNLGSDWACGIALLLMTVGVGFKLSAAPFHQWTPDVYQGSPTPVVAFLSVGSKAAGLVLTIRILTTLFPSLEIEWKALFEVLAVLSMVIGNLSALTQTSLKRMLGYSSVGQAGVLLIGLLTGQNEGYANLIVYLMMYILMNLGALACVILFGLRTGSDQIQDYGGLIAKDPFLAICLSTCLLSLGGIPPLAGFFGKLGLFWSGWQAGSYVLVFIGILTSVISIYYYLGVVKVVLVQPAMSASVQDYPQRAWALQAIQPLEVGIGICVVGTLWLGIGGNQIFVIANQLVAQAPGLGI